jgi:predicted phosphodiesterase
VSRRKDASGFTEYPVDGYKWFAFSDTHGLYADWEAIDAALAASRWYGPQRIILLGDHADFEGISRFEKPPEAIMRLHDDLLAQHKFCQMVRESHPKAKIEYIPGNHEWRLEKFMWKHPEVASLFKSQGLDLPKILRVADFGIGWHPDGYIKGNEKFMWKHGDVVRSKSAVSAMAELERNGSSGASGHTHRLGMHYSTTRTGVSAWAESGCLCSLDPPYAKKGQKMNWQQGISLGSVNPSGHSFTLHTVPIVRGRARFMGMDIGS